MSLTIHQSGIDAAINAQASGFDGVTLNRVDLYNGNSEIKSLTLKGVDVIEPSRIYVVAQDSGTDSYDVTRIEFFTDGDQKFATAQNDDNSVIQSKAANSTLLLAHQLNISTAPGTVAPSGDVSIYAPQATESLLGTAEIANQSEVNTGTDHTRIVTPKTLKSWLSSFVRNATESVKGFVEIATQTEANSSSDDTRAITAKKLHNRTATTSRRGVIELATQTEVDAGTDTGRAIVPATLKAWWDSVRSWNNITGKVNASTSVYGITKLSTSTSSTSTTLGATPSAVKSAKEEGIRQATESLRGQAEIANQTEVNNGTDHQRMVTPKTLTSRLASFVRNASESAKGFIEIATQTEVDAGTDNSRAVTPKKLRLGFVAAFGPAGYIIMPSWMGSFIIQWSVVAQPVTTISFSANVSWPVTFPNECYTVFGSWGVLHTDLDASPRYRQLDSVLHVGIPTSSGVKAHVINKNHTGDFRMVRVWGLGR